MRWPGIDSTRRVLAWQHHPPTENPRKSKEIRVWSPDASHVYCHMTRIKIAHLTQTDMVNPYDPCLH